MLRNATPRAMAIRIAVVATALLACASLAQADQWNERTTLKFSEPVLVPGATLQPGTYVFELADTNTNRNLVEIRKEDGTLVTTTQAVPTKRTGTRGDTVLKFNPTDTGTPPALKAWFYPGSLYGHRFVYSDEQAKKIAERTKTIVLSTDVPGTDLERGTLHTYDASGKMTAWAGDPAVMHEWDAWQRNRRSAAVVHHPTTSKDRADANAPMVQSDFRQMRVKVDDLEDRPSQYIGKAISVDAEVEDVLGPRLFTIDEPNWGDLAGEMYVFVPSPLAALVRENDRVTVTGTVKRFVKADLEGEWGWLGLDQDTERKIQQKPVLVANRIVGGNNNIAMVIDTSKPARTANAPVGTSGSKAGTAADTRTMMTSLADIARGDEDLVGRPVRLSGVTVGHSAEHGFFTTGTGGSVYVLPTETSRSFKEGETVTIEGTIAQMPHAMKDRLHIPSGGNSDIYIYATNITH